MELTTENILDLIEKGKYRSCILTSFSFDFYYFEMNIMRSLRACGIVNISVFIDENILQDNLGNLTGNEHRNALTYSLTSINTNKIFHPKMYLFFGHKDGLLIVGSGNLTASGHGKNDEIWGAFHLSEENFLNAQIFANAWHYFLHLNINTKGYTNEKIKWIKEYTPWLSKLPKQNQSIFQEIDENNSIAFLTNNKPNIFEKTKNLIGTNEVIEITVIAPFFDKKGTALTTIINTFQNAKINVIIDDKNGSIPNELDKKIAQKISFFNWTDCYKLSNFDENNRKLHAKLVIFKSVEHEFCLFGSANISVAGLGINTNQTPNEEVSLLLKIKNSNLLSELNIKIINSNRKKLSDFSNNNKLQENNIFNQNNYLIKLHGCICSIKLTVKFYHFTPKT